MPKISQKVFIDSSFFSAFIDRANLNHSKSVAIMEYLATNNYQVYTSSLTILQTFGRIERDLGSLISVEFLQAILESSIEVFYPTKTELLSAYRFLRTNSQRKASLTDILNADLMQKHNILSILTFDFWHNLIGTRVSGLINP